jgi:hypothetical protein
MSVSTQFKAFSLFVLLLCQFAVIANVYATTKAEKQEEVLTDLERLYKQKAAKNHSVSQACGTFVGYDTNAYLSAIRKGDYFQEIFYSVYVTTQWLQKVSIFLYYELNNQSYREVTDNNNIYNQLRLGLSRKFGQFEAGTGCDLALYFFPFYESCNFFTPQLYAYARLYAGKKMYQQIRYEHGVRYYLDQKALADVGYLYLNKRQKDVKENLEYSIAALMTKDLLVRLKARYYFNDSNVRYEDYYDYHAYEISPVVDYQMNEHIEFALGLQYTHKRYDTRRVTAKAYKQEDQACGANAGMTYNLDKKNALYLWYFYLNNMTNEGLEKYTSNIIKCGYQYSF